VPLRTPAELWREYWQAAYPNFAGTTWPGPVPYLAVSAHPPSGALPYVPITPALWATQQTAALTALAFVMHTRPRARLCMGRLVFLGSGWTLIPSSGQGAGESLEAVALRQSPSFFEPYALTTEGRAPQDVRDERLMADLAERSLGLSVTCLAGTTERLSQFVSHARQRTGRARLTEIWPHLSAVLYARSHVTPGQRLPDELLDAGIPCLEMFIRPEGAVALQDPRHSGLRLLPDHGVYFEFVPVDQLGKPGPARYSAAEVKVGVPYALALSSPAGVWACLVGNVVRFERLDPPLLRLVEMEKFWEVPALTVAPSAKLVPALHAYPMQPPHARRGGRSLRLSAALRGSRD
jgi:hypothetical protein